MFYAHLLLSKRGPLAKIWLAAHWEKKLTKAHIFECNLETTIESIMFPKVTIALRTSGHLLLGVVRIYHRKAKYLLSDCNEAFIKMKMAFRPGAMDLPEDNQEATYNAITLPEEFYDFDIQLPDLNAIDVAEHFTLNQSRAEDITLREDYGRDILHGGFGEDLEVFRHDSSFDGSIVMSTNDSFLPEQSSTSLHEEEKNAFTQDGFGDEGLAADVFDKLLVADSNALNAESIDVSKEVTLPPDLSSEENYPAVGLKGAVPDQPGANDDLVDHTTLLSNEEEAFVLEPVDVSAPVERKRSKRRRNLLVDGEKELSSGTMRQQLMDFTDTVTSVDIAPPTRKLMQWKEMGGIEWLLSNPSQPLINSDLLLVFTRCLLPHGSKNVRKGRAEPEMERMRQQPDGMETTLLEEPGYPQESRLTDTGSSCTDEPSRIEPHTPENGGVDLLSEATVQEKASRSAEEHLETVESDHDDKRTMELLRSLRMLNQSGLSSFSLLKLCRNNYRKQASAKFYSFLVLKKQSAIELKQIRPYSDIIATPGATFHSL
ncbi:double-strand-break repair protein rad21-like protein 1 isoform X2 [Ascaphus truei]|uniref:double-strand-break repair protein rad21-like protein 1 isoform X2 n=1 Tax=Ascaphus truei TaxID=8439 RepID=UPI003F5AA924